MRRDAAFIAAAPDNVRWLLDRLAAAEQRAAEAEQDTARLTWMQSQAELLIDRQQLVVRIPTRRRSGRYPSLREAIDLAIGDVPAGGDAVALILAERARQATAEPESTQDASAAIAAVLPHGWPWTPTSGGRVPELVRAGALIVGEIERLQCAARELGETEGKG